MSSAMQGVCVTLCLFLLFGCSSPTLRQWEFQDIFTQTPRFNAGRLIFSPDCYESPLELEINRTSSGLGFYINLLSFTAVPSKWEQGRTQIEILFDDEDPWIVFPYLLVGEQRLLLPRDVADDLIESLFNESCFTIQVGYYRLFVTSVNFSEAYEKLTHLNLD